MPLPIAVRAFLMERLIISELVKKMERNENVAG